VPDFSDFIVFVDESGDHGMASLDPHYPIFSLAFCIFGKEEYARRVAPAVLRFKFRHFGHDQVILHEHEIRKTKGAFRFLTDATRREPFFADLNALIECTPFTLVASVIDKRLYRSGIPSQETRITWRWGLGWSASTFTCATWDAARAWRTCSSNGAEKRRTQRWRRSSAGCAAATTPWARGCRSRS
jgi:hypothetical protein